MKREGRQHGMVRTCMVLPSPWNSNSTPKFTKFDSPPPTAGFFTRVHQKPTNHSKFTGKCGKPRCNGCHMHPSCKSKDKTKGCQKLRSHDVVSNYRLANWRILDGRPGLNNNFNGFSATGILDHLASTYHVDHHLDDETDDGDDNNVDYDDDDDAEDHFGEGYGTDLLAKSGPSSGGGGGGETSTARLVIEEITAAESSDSDDDKHDGDHEDNDHDDDDDVDDDDMGFCDVGFLLDQVEGEEGWCLVAEM